MQQYFQPYVYACTQVLKELANYESINLRPYITTRNEIGYWDISGIIQISGDIRGLVIISMKKKLAAKIACRLIGAEENISDEDIIDSMGEIINIIAGNAKKMLEMFKLYTSVPKIVSGIKEHYEVWKKIKSQIITVPFKIEKDEFCLSVSLDKMNPKNQNL